MTDYAVRITRLNYTYPGGVKALEGIDLDVRVGERVAIVGPGGAGKSTLLLHLNGVLSGTGTVRIMGQTVEKKNLREVRKHIGLIFQDPRDQLFCPTVFEDVAFGLLGQGIPDVEVSHRVDRALRDAGLDLSIRNRPSHHLSLSECKRVAIAAVLAMGAEILALDEPGGNLDPRSRRHLVEVISALPATVLLATHDLEMVSALCPRMVLMDRGKILADAETKRLLSDGNLMEDHGLNAPLSRGEAC